MNLGLDQFFIALSKSSDPSFQILITLLGFVILYLLNNKLEAICCVFNIGVTGFINLVLKNTIKRSRPIGIKLVEAHGYSFPSGHSSISTAIGIVLIYFILKRIKNKKIAYLISGVILTYLILVGISRVYVGAHYPTDVLGGWFIAIVWSFISITAYKYCVRKGVGKYLDKHFTIKLNKSKDKSKDKFKSM
ncbi:phosphatase PAP2 family protein [Clostridium algoriphilum]|uniref:phosphatase PAP2 family protein n=1 Tax=Clostridium algoriphilum TaxID=198347 RepID=UPI001CF18436|nr:phosphatase PAP2 family protein [Clostridium algoriphilum]MCB2293711.1 phosphatase PAP2 family protein [Clostridium algoriphilum]